MVGVILLRAGFDEEAVAAAILHDVVEDTACSLAEITHEFGPRVARLVDLVTETKRDAAGNELPWEERKQSKIAKFGDAPVDAKAIFLADKLHNLQSTWMDERAGQPVWSRFKVPRARWLEVAAAAISACRDEDPRLQRLLAECQDVLARLTR
jgi:(p)ppGpp synthase/HD superfamily hydrolase